MVQNVQNTPTCTLGWSVEFFLIGQKRSINQRSGMILAVQYQNFGASSSKFPFSKNSRGPKILIFFCENWHGASFYIKEQTQKYKFETVRFWFWRKPPQKMFFFVFRFWFSFKNNRHTNILLVSIIEKE